MNKETYLNSISEKRERINYMHQIIKKVKEDEICSELQLDVLLRGYIVLIYSMWESAFKDLHHYFYNSLKEKTVQELPFKIKNKILCECLEKARIKEVKNHTCIERLKTQYDLLKSSYVRDIDIKYFNYFTNNPNIEILKEFIAYYSFKIMLSEENEKRVEYIIKARNDIAHSGKKINNLQNDIKSAFNCKEEIDFLQDVTLDIFVIFNNIINTFEEKFMH